MIDVRQADSAHVWHPFTQAKTAAENIEIVRGEGPWLYSANGDRILDLISSWWVNIHGHAHPRIAAAIGEQAQRLEQVIFAGMTHAPAAKLAKRLTGLARFDRVFFSDNGSTSVEVAVKMAMQTWFNRGFTARTRILAFEGGYHGDTFGAMSVGRTSGFHAPFASSLFSVDFLPYPATFFGDDTVDAREAAALEKLDCALEKSSEIAALIVEPLLQGAGGMRMSRPVFIDAVVRRAQDAGVLVIFDEVMTGFGRTGSLFAADRLTRKPDFLCLSKGITGGFLPLGATLCREETFAAFLADDFSAAFAHGHSYTANPLACAAANASLDLFAEEGTLDRLPALESVHRDALTRLVGDWGVAAEPRVVGSVAAFRIPSAERGYASAIGLTLRSVCLKSGLLVRPLGDVVYLMPPLSISVADLEWGWDRLSHSVREALRVL